MNQTTYELSKLDLAEHFYRGGYQCGYEAALADVLAALSPVEAHVEQIAAWAGGDPSIERDPPVVGLDTSKRR